MEVGLFLVPFVLYAAFLVITRSGISQSTSWTARHVAGLAITSLVLVIGSLFLLGQFSGAPPGSTYVPAHMENGKLVPGATR